jgi:hypothetical protein
MLIPGEFGFAGDLHADGNVLSLANLHCAPGIKKLPLANFLYASGIKVIPDELETGSPGIKFQKNSKKSKKSQKNSNILKTELILKTENIYEFFDHFITP